MQLQLERPLIVFDLETTGIHVSSDRIIDIFMIKILPDNTEYEYYKRLNPGIPIPEQSSDIHGIYPKDVRDAPSFKDIANELNTFIGDADFAGFNSNRFDFPMLVEEFYRAELDFDIENRQFIDAQRIFHTKEPRNLSAAYSFYCDKNLEDAHSAAADTRATWEIIKAQVDKYQDLSPTVKTLHKFSGQSDLVDLAGRIKNNKKGEPCFAFGKHKNKTIKEVYKTEPSYFVWMRKGNFSENTKRVINRLLLQLKTQEG